MNEVSIQWFPGHMTRTKRQMQKLLPLVEGVIELLDARVPLSSRNPDIKELIQNKPEIILLNKADTADPVMTDKWINELRKTASDVIPVDCRSGHGLDKIVPAIRKMLAPLIEKYEQKGMSGRTLHLMVVGIPNVGKSSFINKMAGQSKAKVEDRPGVTREKQWVRISDTIEFLDTPGVLWPKFEDMAVGEKHSQALSKMTWWIRSCWHQGCCSPSAISLRTVSPHTTR